MEHTISVKQILVDLISIMPQVVKEFKANSRYRELIIFFETKDYYNDEDLPYPTLKQVESETGLKTHKIRTLLKEMYDNLFDSEYDYAFNFKNVEIQFIVKYFKRYASFKCNDLIQIPRVGENITLPFLKAKIGTDSFYVEDIRHYFESDKQLINIQLLGGYYNVYWYYRKHKALELGEIGRGEQFDLYEYEMKKRLGLRF